MPETTVAEETIDGLDPREIEEAAQKELIEEQSAAIKAARQMKKAEAAAGEGGKGAKSPRIKVRCQARELSTAGAGSSSGHSDPSCLHPPSLLARAR